MKARTGTWLLMLPGLLWLGLLMVVPCLLVFVLIFFERGVYGGIDWRAPTLENSPASSIHSICRSSGTAR